MSQNNEILKVAKLYLTVKFSREDCLVQLCVTEIRNDLLLGAYLDKVKSDLIWHALEQSAETYLTKRKFLLLIRNT